MCKSHITCGHARHRNSSLYGFHAGTGARSQLLGEMILRDFFWQTIWVQRSSQKFSSMLISWKRSRYERPSGLPLPSPVKATKFSRSAILSLSSSPSRPSLSLHTRRSRSGILMQHVIDVTVCWWLSPLMLHDVPGRYLDFSAMVGNTWLCVSYQTKLSGKTFQKLFAMSCIMPASSVQHSTA